MNKIITSIFSLSLLLTQTVFAAEGTSNTQTLQTQATSTAATTATAPVGKININTADAATLAKGLDGVGEVKAKAIVDYRTQNGPFKAVDDLAKVTGIGAATIEKNKNKVVLQ